ncbi:MAG: hypothetical protein IPK22_26495 [Verrucomicrobiaceae bacterium]|nr:hypothetical protein [Verrucomicrobiaceae bacterium]
MSTLSTAKVIQEERDEIQRQRGVRFPRPEGPGGTEKDKKEAEACPPAPADEKGKGPLGLCFSGGGIRSATLNLGILQALHEAGLLRMIDYLSTVSGGGYIGSWFTAMRHRLALAGKDAASDDFLKEGEISGSPTLRHLRSFSRYLAPKAGITSGDTWTMAAIWLRNTGLIQLMVVSILVLLMVLVNGVPTAFQYIVHDGRYPSLPVLCWPETLWFWMVVVQILCGLVAYNTMSGQLDLVAKNQADEVKQATPWGPALKIALSLTTASFLGAAQIYLHYGCMVLGKQPSVWTEDFVVWGFTGFVAVLCVRLIRKTIPDEVWKGDGKLKKGVGLGEKAFFYLGGFAVQWLAGMTVVWALGEVFEALVGTSPAKGLSGPPISWAAILSVPMLMICYGLVQVMSIGILGNRSSKQSLEWLARAGAWALMVITLAALVMGVVVAGPQLVDLLFSAKTSTWLKTSLVGGWITASVSAVVLGKGESTSGKPNTSGIKERLLGFLPLIMLAGILLLLSWVVRWMFIKLMAAPPCQAHAFLADYFDEGKGFPCLWLFLTVIFAALSCLLVWRIDLNEFSMNPFYRNRLVRCYLGATRQDARQPHGSTGFDFADDFPMAEMQNTSPVYDKQAKPLFPGPLHIINMAANSGTSAGLDTQERSAESFSLTPLHAGFNHMRFAMPQSERDPLVKVPHRAYSPTPGYAGDWTLGQALSVSGAAASPNSGYHTSPIVAFLLTLFNARLGWWTARPGDEESGANRPRGFFGYLKYLAMELTGSASLTSRFIYLSDGGHFENLGLYELVRRRCRLIIVGDGECDPGHTFHALGTAIRRCQVDMGVDIDIDTRDLVPDEKTGLCRAHAAFGTIKYPDAPPATLVYLKSSLTGEEELDIQQYKSLSPTFPHESTGDQFFSESQFESYRKLGLHMARKTLEPNDNAKKRIKAIKKLPATASNWTAHNNAFDKYFEELQLFWKPPPRISSASFVNHSTQLTAIWREAQKDPDLAGFDAVIIPKWSRLHSVCCGLPVDVQAAEAMPATLALAPEPARKAAYLCQELLQLMENVYLDLDLHHAAGHEDHRGWMELFKYWAKQPAIRQSWQLTYQTFGERFETFCDEVLDMPAKSKPPES